LIEVDDTPKIIRSGKVFAVLVVEKSI